MAETFARLSESVYSDGKPISSTDLLQRLRSSSDSIRPGLENLLPILKRGVEADGDGKLGLQLWTDSQIQAVYSIAYAVASASRSLLVDQADAIIVAIVQQSLEFAVCYLERSEFSTEDMSIQNNMVHLLEMALIDGMDKTPGALRPCSVDSLVDLLPSVTHNSCGNDLDNHNKCGPQGVNCSRAEKPVDRLFLSLASECIQSDRQTTGFGGPAFHQDFNKLVFLTQHWAAVHAGCIRRLILLCKGLIVLPDMFDEKSAGTYVCKRLSFSLRIIKLLGSLTKDIPYIEYDASLVQAVASFADAVPGLFRPCFEFVNSHVAVEGSFESLSLLLLEDFLELVRVTFCNSSVFLNVQVCVVASMLDNLDASVWRYNKAAANLKPPLAYFPRIVVYMLMLIQDLKRKTSRAVNWKELDTELTGSSANFIDSPSCLVHSEKIPLLQRYTFEHLVQIIFPSSKQWMDDLMHLIFFLHSEGVKLRPKVERSYSSCAKTTCSSELENVVCHEDEALFGDLFSESVRGSTDGYDQPSVVANSSSSQSNMPMEAAMELLSFVKVCIFSPEWHPSVFEDGCAKLSRGHIDIFLSLLHSQGCPEDRTPECYSLSHEEKKIGHTHELCFDLLQDLVTRHALSDSIEEDLVEKILNVENDIFVYNNQTLTLLAHTLFCRVGLAGSSLRTQIFRGFVDFVVEKTKTVSLKCPTLKELLEALPSAFHIEILLVAFHLSSKEEKVSQANLIFSALRAIGAPTLGFNSTHLSCWALLVSRLVLVLRHMVFYPQTYPSSLLVHLRSKLREAPYTNAQLGVNDHLSSWVSVIFKNVMSASFEEESDISPLIHQLIDTSTFPALLSIDYVDIDSLCLNWDEICSTMSLILGLWKGKQAAVVEDLIVERYIFILCWDFPTIGTSKDHQVLSSSNPQNLDISDMENFIFFSHSILGHQAAVGAKTNSEAIVQLLQLLHTEHISDHTEELGWGFLRNATWLSLALSLLDVGIWRYGMKNKVPGVGSNWIENMSKDNEYVAVAEGLIASLMNADQVSILLKTFSSLLNSYLLAYQKAFVATFGNSQKDADGFSPLLLFKHSGFDKCLQDELGKTGTYSFRLESLIDPLAKFDVVIDKRASGILCRASWEWMLHGFPLNLRTSSGFLFSCILNIRGIVSILVGLLKMKDMIGNVCLETEVLHQILDMVVTIKFDRIFESIHGKCETIYDSLSVGLGATDFANLILLEHLEGFLRDINARGVSDSSIHECIVTKAIDTMDSLRKDPVKVDYFKLYLGIEDVPEQVKKLFGVQRGDLLVLIDTLHNCDSETVNIKVLNFFVALLTGELFPGLKQKIQNKFLGMDLVLLSKWLEKRLLGCVTEASGGVNSAKGSSVSLRESTMNFILCIVSSPSNLKSTELQSHIFEAILVSLEPAFLQFDIHVAKSFFQFVVQLSKGDASVRLLLKRTIMLMEKLAGNDSLLPGLKFLFGFFGSVLSDCGSGKNTQERSSGKSLPVNALGVGSMAPRPVGSRKNSEALVLSSNQEGGSMALECDATSVDEDEDDGTSDGEVASLDKDDEEDTNSERALASKVCTFTSSGNNFMEQHWYFCYTCDLTVSKGCCSVCAKVCHRGHRVVYSRSSRFFCDCGAGGVRGSNCQCLKPRKFTGSSNAPVRSASNFQAFLPFTDDEEQLPESDSDFDEDTSTDVDNSLRLSIPRELQDAIVPLLEELDVEGQVLELCSSLFAYITCKRDSNMSKDNKITLGKDKMLSFGVDLLQLKKAYKSGSLDLKIKADYSNAKELKSHLASGSLVKSLLSVSLRGRLAVGEGDKVAIFDVEQLIGQATIAPVTADKTNVKPLSKNVIRFEIVHLTFNPVVENYLAVAGYEDCQVLTVNPRGEVTDRLAIELALQGAHIRRVDWVPGSQVQLMVVTNKFVKIYDLSQDNISPIHYFTLPDDVIVDATLVVASQGRMFLIVLSEHGKLFRLELSVEGNMGATPLKEVIPIQDKVIDVKGSSLYFSSAYKLLFLSYQDGTTLLGRLSPNASSLSEISTIYEEEQDVKQRSAGLHRWKELLAGSGLFVCFSSIKLNSAIAVSIGSHELFAQNLRHAVGSTSPVVGVTAYKPLSKDKIHCLVLHDDGSLQIYSHTPMGVDANASATAEKVKKLGSRILSNKAYAGTNPEFPLDFFEKTVCITADVKLGGDAIRNGDSEGAKLSLASEDGFLESPSPAGCKISVFNLNPDIIMVGLRVHVGNTSANHIPSDITIFHRAIKLDEGMRSWYDIPFTVAESLLADEEFTISVGPTFNGSALPRIDCLEVYGRAKDEFGWKEKMDAILDMEARVLGSNSLLSGSGKKRRSMQSAPMQEQVIADGLKILSRIYSLCRSRGCSRVEEISPELSKLRCKQLLEKIFESDREPLLQAAACHVLQAVFTKKDTYYQVKDTMQLLGVVKSTSVLSSRLGVGGTAGAWIIEEFTAQMRAVSKIALHRRSNLATFLEIHGSEVIDGLIQVLWGILDLEQLDTQTMNNIVISSVELIYCYAECLALHGKDTGVHSVGPAAVLFKKLLFLSNEAVQTSTSLAISSRLLQVPFPKQTMLATDDVAENAVSAPVHAGTTGGNAQVTTEEDSITSSVQYCCDGCTTVPILRRRWHCTICPDFDLCEACYEVLDADRLPLPHSRDHPMTAIPIEVESLGRDGNEFHFTPDDVSDSSILPTSADARTQNSAPSIHVLEPNESGEFSASVNDSVSISASKRALNSLLLFELLEQLKGWMQSMSGVQAIPVMQLFYRLSSAVGGPFIDISKPESLDLEKLIRWFLDELNLNQPFVAKSRSTFGEVAILVFMFFTLMLRNWHQPGSDGSTPKPSGTTDTHDKSIIQISPSTLVAASSSLDDQEKNDFASQLLRACNSLRQQSVVNYLMEILQQLVHVFKSPSVSCENAGPGSGCSALLTVRRDVAAGNFSPFFSDSYAKAHRTDIFVDYHRLLLENTFRLVYTLVRPEKQDKTGEKEKVSKISSGKDLKLDGYQDVLCGYINNPHTTFVRRYARRLFLHLCGSKTHYYTVRDSWQFSSEMKKLFKHVNKSGGLQSHLSYERSVKIVKCLSTMAEVAAARPRNWQKYCLKHSDFLPFLINGVFYLGEESVIQILKLLNLSFYTGKEIGHSLKKTEAVDSVMNSNKSGTQSHDPKKKKKGEEGMESGSEKSYVDVESLINIFTDRGGDVLKQFIDCFLLEWNSSSVRAEAKCVLYGVWHHAKSSFKETLVVNLLEKVKCLPMYGQNIVEYTELITWLLGKAPDDSSKQQSSELVDRCLTPDVVKCIFETLHSQNELLANHPNSRIYNTLSGLVEFDGYYLESEPCVACSSPEVPYSRMKLESLKSETKFTDNRIIVKCTGSYTIQTSKSVKVLNLYYNNRPVADLSELKNNWSLWKRAKSCHLTFNQTELKVDFPIPITASWYCGNCHENAYQCRQCRNINYENLDSFLCNECGYSKYGRFEFNFMAKPSFAFDDMENDEDMKRGLAAIETESENAHRKYQQLLGFKKPLLKIVSSKDSVQQMMVSLPGPVCKINRKIALLGVLYGENVQTLQGLRRVLMNYLHQKQSVNEGCSRFVVSRSPNNCYGCASTFAHSHPNSKKQLVAAGILTELFENNIHQGPKTARVQARAVLCAFSEGDINAVTELNSLIQKKVTYCLEHHRSMDVALATREELSLLSEVCSLTDEFWESRLRVVFQLLFSSIKLGAKHPAISEHVILPCLRVISQACTPPKPDVPDKEPNTGKANTGSQIKDESNSSMSGSLGGHSGGTKSAEPLDKNWDTSQKDSGHSIIKLCGKTRPQRQEFLALKYALRWKRRTVRQLRMTCQHLSWGLGLRNLLLYIKTISVIELIVSLLPATLSAGESAAEYFDCLFKMIDSEEARLFLTVRGCLGTICKLITQEVGNVESLERSMRIDISQGFILHKLIELLDKFLQVPNIRSRFMRDNLLSEVLEALILISDCNRLLNDLLDSLLLESSENKRQFIRACVCGLQNHGEERKGRTCLFILEQLCNLICPSKPEPVYLLVLNKAHTQEEFIRGSMTKNPYSSSEIGPLMRDVKNKICHQLDLLGLVEDDYGMELLVAGNIISLDLSIAQVYEQVWKKSSQSSNAMANTTLLSPNAVPSARDSPPMTVTYRLQGLDGEATEPMIKELEEDREESQDPEVEFAIAGAVREYGGLEIILSMIQMISSPTKSSWSVLNLLMHCCKIRENRRALLRLGALGLLLETARRAFSVDAMEPAEGILLIVESLTLEANESDNISITQSALTVTSEETRGITGVAVRHLSDSFSVAGQAGFKSSAEWATGLKLPSVPLILSMLRGLSTGHLATQKCIDEGGILPLLHALEGVPGENEIGARAENLLDTLSNKEGKGDGFLEEKVRRLRHATRDEMRRRALRKREELLQGLGMRQELASDGGERIVVSRPLLEGLEDVEEEEEDGLACMVCREGYSLRPTDLLGVYSYSKRVNLGAGTSGSARGECVYTTVSYFNIIHFQCHQEAKRADAALKNPKKEWEGATLRKMNLFYIRYVDQFWDNLNALGRADGSRLRLLTYDIVLIRREAELISIGNS
ncbi:auxin transport protein BIG-like [Pyrus ussuriensis x Pyrus communis]|uniref:Auxin transport protein BIG n=1 Tax=Pyrus ussuriensis x Pyrus communis TaxID=2448454 RepID=A0A5N5GEL9_9ROSA|nr:auxin transport protein BIG-like [Pyrus ussuriensis x Pyrus communis]